MQYCFRCKINVGTRDTDVKSRDGTVTRYCHCELCNSFLEQYELVVDKCIDDVWNSDTRKSIDINIITNCEK